ncbi:hypothetical protein [Ramlibacter sp.]|uniref:hypothetical protein n=1 Tax=Ramlibacter sp. TaxID=1917967 RepID=UPI0017D41E2A|nr:hypothetical protein [Ramlibacter sp.]MBA2675461.1 hypothetical protein [Ramlibacter sp.]
MEPLYTTRLIRFNEEPQSASLSLKAAIQALKTDEATAALLDITSPEDAPSWYDDDGFTSSPFTRNAHHSGTVATAVTMGQLQREQKERLVAKAGEYFSVAARINDDLRRTKYVRLFSEALDARPLTMDGLYPYEFLMATRRMYDPHDEPFNFAPHCDDITYGRDPDNWPMRQQYPKQIGTFLTTQSAENDAGFVMWDCRPASRAVLDRMHAEYRESGTIAELDRSPRFTVRPRQGQLLMFQSKVIHAVERCTSRRLTVGMFLVEQENGWRFFD